MPVGDLPREATQLSELRQAHEALGQLLGVKDRMIWDLVRERDALKVGCLHVQRLEAACVMLLSVDPNALPVGANAYT